MNWNSSEGIGRYAIILSFAKKVRTDLIGDAVQLVIEHVAQALCEDQREDEFLAALLGGGRTIAVIFGVL
jgi:hypothetical protein